jgi:cell division protein YceG involved in septum cleavage
MWVTIIKFIVSKLDWIKSKAVIILAVIAVLTTLAAVYYRYSLVELETKITKLDIKQEIKVEYIEKIIEKDRVIYNDRIKKEYIYNDNKSMCENAIAVIRSTNI